MMRELTVLLSWLVMKRSRLRVTESWEGTDSLVAIPSVFWEMIYIYRELSNLRISHSFMIFENLTFRCSSSNISSAMQKTISFDPLMDWERKTRTDPEPIPNSCSKTRNATSTRTRCTRNTKRIGDPCPFRSFCRFSSQSSHYTYGRNQFWWPLHVSRHVRYLSIK